MQLIRDGNVNPLQYSCLENPRDGGAWWAAVRGVAKSQTRLSDFAFTFHFHALEKAMAAHSRVPAWRTPGTGEPGGLTPMGSQSRTRLKRLSSSSHSWLLLTSNISWQSSFCLKKPFTDYVLWGKFLNLLYFSDVRSGWTGKSGFQSHC